MPAKKKAPDLESSLTELEALVARMESGELTLEESLQAFEQGIKLTRECQQRLTQAEQQVQTLIEENGQPVLQDFDPTDDA
ncbi:exodeoxyribonuclease VII small subunit [Gilvimarinus sp. DA14]|uniref:exodeoxyribonuclease VII small subunit n=1 Tax=Gilvimarinus sp. DA14 TaxID=2956798 RepID=UPI0020B8305B|nr:exodeoxyribonuclease VII small subunit [Gilvimarinus sp. DA14]UTF61911.1 exodeoxyribonuclease VII small subunit [Gilvimarinus sp. DA14]